MANNRNVTTYIHFKDNCREAMEFYKQILGGELDVMTAEGTPMADQVPPDKQKMVMHANLTGDGWAIMASDWMSPNEYIHGNNFSLMMDCPSDEELNSLFAKLAAGGQVMMPLAPTFWGATFGMLKDKFGIDWMLSHRKEGG